MHFTYYLVFHHWTATGQMAIDACEVKLPQRLDCMAAIVRQQKDIAQSLTAAYGKAPARVLITNIVMLEESRIIAPR